MNSLPVCSAGTFLNVAVSGATYRFRIVPVAELVPRSAPEAFDSVTVNVSSLSSSASAAIATEIVLLVVPASKVSVRPFAVARSSADATSVRVVLPADAAIRAEVSFDVPPRDRFRDGRPGPADPIDPRVNGPRPLGRGRAVARGAERDVVRCGLPPSPVPCGAGRPGG